MGDSTWTVAWVLWAAAAVSSCGGHAPPAAEPSPPEPVAPVAPVASTEPVSPLDAAPAEDAKAEPDLRARMREATNGILEAFNAHDARKLAGFFAGAATATVYGAWEARGPDEIARGAVAFFAAFGDAKAVALRVWIKGDVVVEETAWAGTMTGDFLSYRATHGPVGQVRAEVFVFDPDGHVKELRAYGDDAGLVAQMRGRKDAPPAPPLPVNPPDVHVAGGTPEEEGLVAWARAGDAALEKGERDALVARFADDGDDWMSFRGPARRGRKALAKEIADWESAFPDQKWTTTAAWGIDGFAIVEHAMTGRQKGPLGSLKGSNKPVAGWHWLTVTQASGDRTILHAWQHASLLELMKQTGALETARPSTPRPASKPPVQRAANQ